MVSVSRAPYFSLSIFFIPRSFVLRWLPHSVLPIGIILIYFCFVLIWPSLVIILCYIKQPLFCFCQHPTTIVCLSFQQLFACVNINQQPLVYIQHQLLLMSNGNFLLTTLLTNHVSRNQFVNYCVYVFPNNLYQPFHLIFQQPFIFLQPFVNQQPIQLIFFSAISLSTKLFYFNSAILFSCFL